MELEKLLSLPDEEIVLRAKKSMILTSSEESSLFVELGSPQWNRRKKAAELIMALGLPERVIDQFQDIHKNTNEDQAYWGIRILGNLKSREAFNLLRLCLLYGDRKKKLFAIEAMEGFEGELSLPVLVDCLGDKSWSVRREAAALIMKNGEKNPGVVDFLINSMTGDEDRKYWVMRILGALLKSQGVSALAEFYHQGNSRDRFFAVLALGETRAYGAIEPLIDALADESWMIRKQAAELLVLFGTQAKESLKVAILQRDESDIKYWGLQVLARILGSEAMIYFQGLLKTVQDNPDLRTYIIIALGSVEGTEAVDLLIDSFDDNHWIIRRQAYEVLLLRPQEAFERIVFRLEKAFEEQKENICHWSVKYLLSKPQLALPPLRRLIVNGKTSTKLSVIATLGDFSDIRTAPLLIELLDDPAWPVRSLASRALTDMGAGIIRDFEAWFRVNKTASEDRWYWTERAIENIEGGPEFLKKTRKTVTLISRPENSSFLAHNSEKAIISKDAVTNRGKVQESPKILGNEAIKEPEISGKAWPQLGQTGKEKKEEEEEFVDPRLTEAKRQFERIAGDLARTTDEDILMLGILSLGALENLDEESAKLAIETVEKYISQGGDMAQAAKKAIAALGRRYEISVEWKDEEYEILKDLGAEDQELRKKALEKLANNPLDGSRERLIARLALEESSEMILLVIRALSHYKDDELTRELERFVNHKDGRIALAAMRSLSGQMPTIDGIIAKISENKATDGDIMALTLFSEEEIRAKLEKADNNARIAFLNRLWINGGTQMLVDLVQNEKIGMETRISAISALGGSGDKNILRWLEGLGGSDDSSPLRVRAKEAKQKIEEGHIILSFLELENRMTNSPDTMGDESKSWRDELLIKLGRLSFDLLRSGILKNPELARFLYEIQGAEAALDRRRQRLMALDEGSTSSGFITGALGRIRESVTRRKEISGLEREVELASDRLMAKLKELGEEISNNPSAKECGSKELLRLLEQLNPSGGR